LFCIISNIATQMRLTFGH